MADRLPQKCRGTSLDADEPVRIPFAVLLCAFKIGWGQRQQFLFVNDNLLLLGIGRSGSRQHYADSCNKQFLFHFAIFFVHE